MTRPPLVSPGALSSPFPNTKPTHPPMNTNTASDPSNPKRCANGGDYVTEGMAVQQQLAPGALTPVL
jgi:hypothetical protein